MLISTGGRHLAAINKRCNMEIWPHVNTNPIKVCLNLPLFVADIKDKVFSYASKTVRQAMRGNVQIERRGS